MVTAGLGVAALPLNARQISLRVKFAMRPLVRPMVARRVCLFLRRDLTPSPAAAACASPAAAAFRDLRQYVKAGGYPGARGAGVSGDGHFDRIPIAHGGELPGISLELP